MVLNQSLSKYLCTKLYLDKSMFYFNTHNDLTKINRPFVNLQRYIQKNTQSI